MTNQVNQSDSVITVSDGVSLDATIFESDSDNGKVVIFACAMGVNRSFYHKFAAFLARHGFNVVTFDYRGMSPSSKSINAKKTLMRDWGRLDLSGVIDWTSQRYPEQRILVVAQSAGGQLVGVTPNNDKISAMLAITSQSGYWGHWSGWHKWAVFVLWYFFIPVLTRLRSHFPSKYFGMGQDLPSGVARQWAYWGRHPEYLLRENEHYFEQFKAPILFYSFTDDLLLGPKNAAHAITEFYHNAKITWKHAKPKDYNTKAIGHFGFFKSSNKDTLWQEALEWLNQH